MLVAGFKLELRAIAQASPWTKVLTKVQTIEPTTATKINSINKARAEKGANRATSSKPNTKTVVIEFFRIVRSAD
jgi:hypothetical protein